MRTILMLLALIGVQSASGEVASEAVEIANFAMTDGPKAVVSGTLVKLGSIPRGKPIEKPFVVENTGTTALEIAVKPNCGCTAVEFDRDIKPGQKGNVTIALNTASLTGEFRKTVDVSTNDSTLPGFELIFEGNAIPALEISPSLNQAVRLKADHPTVQEYDLHIAPGVTVEAANVSKSYLAAAVERIDENACKLRLTVDESAPMGRTPVVVVLKTSAEYEPTIPMTIYLEKGIMTNPTAFVMSSPGKSSGKPVQSSILIRKNEGGLRIRKVTCDDSRLRFTVTSLREGFLYQVKATAVDGGIFARMPSKVIVETDDPKQPILEIPIRAANTRSFADSPS